MKSGPTLAHYTIIRQVGKGGMGEVSLAQDNKFKREVAVKVLPESVQSDPEGLKRFRREPKATKLNHPNITTIHALEEFDDVLLIVLEYGEGETLSSHIPSDGLANAGPPAVIRGDQHDSRFLYLH
jgi:serine/threonine protein kinase